MIFYGSGTVALIFLSVFSFMKVDMGVEGTVGGIICGLFAFATFCFFIQKTRQFVSGTNILGWLI